MEPPAPPGDRRHGATLAGSAALLDAIVVAPFLERSFAMFESLADTWIPLALIFAASAATAALLSRPAARRDVLGWIATAQEQIEPLPGDHLLSVESGAAHAITIAAAPAAVWPWLAQAEAAPRDPAPFGAGGARRAEPGRGDCGPIPASAADVKMERGEGPFTLLHAIEIGVSPRSATVYFGRDT